PTYEAIDPVRFIGNHSSGKMGHEIAISAAQLGAEVILISGPSQLKTQHHLIDLIEVTSAQDMFEACDKNFRKVNVFIAAAAVADYRPKNVASQKIKKSTSTLSIELEKTIDILETLGNQKENQFIIGFALETEDEIENAKLKIIKKNLDLIVLNSLNDEGAGFGGPTNKVTFINKDFLIESKSLKLKEEVAKDILEKVVLHLKK
ncbi:MAG TPA: phosphopantothenoylcysteine decarboxylase, partial [Flavobacterium sp.]|nr:phosphopantothenoylcysteine decarboxylase [Flavobacterium sp.]